jgi:uncharacterized protein YodC (DUF2158 family)
MAKSKTFIAPDLPSMINLAARQPIEAVELYVFGHYSAARHAGFRDGRHPQHPNARAYVLDQEPYHLRGYTLSRVYIPRTQVGRGSTHRPGSAAGPSHALDGNLMRYYIDTEFNGFGGRLISMALIREDGRSIYFMLAWGAVAMDDGVDPWVLQNVIPILRDCPEPPLVLTEPGAASYIAKFLSGDEDPVIIADWPDDLRHFCELIITGPGEMISIPGLRMEVKRVDAYPTTVENAVQHNAWWDALALKAKIEEEGVPEPGPETCHRFKVGDSAYLKSGGPQMCVEYDQTGTWVKLVWMVDGVVHHDQFPATCLRPSLGDQSTRGMQDDMNHRWTGPHL